MLLVKGPGQPQKRVYARVVIVAAFKLVILILEVWQSVPGAPDHAHQLGKRYKEVKDLRYEKEKHCLAKVAEDGGDCESHPGEVAVGVAHEDARGERVVLHEGERGHQEGNDYGHGELVLVVNQRAFLVQLHFLFIAIYIQTERVKLPQREVRERSMDELTMTLCMSTKQPITIDWPTSRPFSPA